MFNVFNNRRTVHRKYAYLSTGGDVSAAYWQTSPEFSGLMTATSYDFYQRVKETTTTLTSDVSTKLEVRTATVTAMPEENEGINFEVFNQNSSIKLCFTSSGNKESLINIINIKGQVCFSERHIDTSGENILFIKKQFEQGVYLELLVDSNLTRTKKNILK